MKLVSTKILALWLFFVISMGVAFVQQRRLNAASVAAEVCAHVTRTYSCSACLATHATEVASARAEDYQKGVLAGLAQAREAAPARGLDEPSGPRALQRLRARGPRTLDSRCRCGT